MNAEILAVGTEILMGQIANTNAQYISGKLPEVGIGVYYHSVVGDNPKRLEECLDIALKRSDIVITTGGLGPTQDDLTKETIAKSMNKKLVLHDESLYRIKCFFERLNRPMADNNVKQAYLPEGCIVLENGKGTAPGCIIESEGKTIIMLPGPPSEMKPMFDSKVIPYFESKMQSKIISRYIRIFRVGESLLEEKLIDIIENQKNPTIAPYAKEGEVTLRVTASAPSVRDAEKLIKPVIEEIRSRLGNTVYSIDNQNLDEVAGELLIKNNITISMAESCTGGLISSRLTGIPGISKVFNRAVVCYSNQSKIDDLGVDSETIEKYGAVSEQTAVEMAKGIRQRAGTDIGLSVTGIAGPDGGTLEKPVGLVYIALADKNDIACMRLNLWGDRDRIRNVTCLYAFDMIRKYILNID